jgi:SseB protein N-terminal domain
MGLFRRRAQDSPADTDALPVAAPPPRQRDPRVGADPVIDVNERVSNPALIAAINQCVAGNADPADMQAMFIAFARAVYLLPVTYSRPPEDLGDGRVHLSQGTQLAFHRFPMSANSNVYGFGVCTDEAAFHRCAPEGASQQVMRAIDLFPFVLRDPDNAGFVLNPGDEGAAMPLYRPWCEEILHLLGR